MPHTHQTRNPHRTEPLLDPTRPRLSVSLASCTSEVVEVQRLRYQVFSGELGARLHNAQAGLDQDMYDAFCDHLLVRDHVSGRVVGTYRILTPESAKRIGGYYSEREFDLNRLRPLAPRMVEVGRACVHPEYRTGAAIALLWSGLAEYMRNSPYKYLMGCASIGMSDGGQAATTLFRRLARNCMSPTEWRVVPRYRLPMEAFEQDVEVVMPPLIKGYLRAGALICGEPAWDLDFNTADLLMLLPVADISQRYARHFPI